MVAREEVQSEVTGIVWKIEVSEGDRVEEEDTLMILESMKMEIPVESPGAATVSKILVSVEDAVEEGQVVVILET